MNNENCPASEDSPRSSNSNDQQPLCRFFFLQGTCRYGDNCMYSHTLPPGLTLFEARKQIPCPYYRRGNCRYGDECQLGHIDEDRTATTCGICLDDVVQSRKRFGLLLNCTHCYCLDCLRQWRKSKIERSLSEEGETTDTTRCCPACRKRSDYIVPSNHFCTGEEKERIIQSYKAHLATVPCKRFTGAIGSCLFGRECFYAHLGPDGEDIKPVDKERRQSRPTNHRRDHLFASRMAEMNAMILTLRAAEEVFGDLSIDFWDSDDESIILTFTA